VDTCRTSSLQKQQSSIVLGNVRETNFGRGPRKRARDVLGLFEDIVQGWRFKFGTVSPETVAAKYNWF
jgi:hypothetical protein